MKISSQTTCTQFYRSRTNLRSCRSCAVPPSWVRVTAIVSCINFEESKRNNDVPRAQSCYPGGGCSGDSQGPLDPCASHSCVIAARPTASIAGGEKAFHERDSTKPSQAKANQIRHLVQNRDTGAESADQALARIPLPAGIPLPSVCMHRSVNLRGAETVTRAITACVYRHSGTESAVTRPDGDHPFVQPCSDRIIPPRCRRLRRHRTHGTS